MDTMTSCLDYLTKVWRKELPDIQQEISKYHPMGELKSRVLTLVLQTRKLVSFQVHSPNNNSRSYQTIKLRFLINVNKKLGDQITRWKDKQTPIHAALNLQLIINCLSKKKDSAMWLRLVYSVCTGLKDMHLLLMQIYAPFHNQETASRSSNVEEPRMENS